MVSKICCIGAGYVGGPTMAVIAKMCPDIIVTVVDNNEEKIKKWNSINLDNLPVFEPGLKEIIYDARNKNLFFSNDIDTAIEQAEMIFIAVNTPTKTFGEGKGKAADLMYVENCARKISEVATSDKIVIEKSTLPVRTAEAIKEILKSSNNSKCHFEVLSNPEFLAEGTAIKDLYKSDRVLIGSDSTKTGLNAMKKLKEIYLRWVPEEKILTTNIWSSELSKLVANAFLAQRISSINSISAICEKTGANVNEISRAIGMDHRIGSKFLKASVGFGGSCFKKDILNLVYIAESLGLEEVAKYWQSVVDINNYQTNRFGNIILKSLYNTVSEKKITIFGWSFKKDTNDSRESAAIYLTKFLLLNKAKVSVYDPKVKKDRIVSDLVNVSLDNDIINSNLIINNNPNEAANNSHAIAIVTEWDEFIDLNWKEIYKILHKPAKIFDGRNILDKEEIEKIGFNLYSIGKTNV